MKAFKGASKADLYSPRVQAALAALSIKPVKPSKYGNRKTVVDGITFDSGHEARRYGELKLLERGRDISDLRIQPEYPIEIEGVLVCKYVADFEYLDWVNRLPDGSAPLVVEDAKGVRTDVYKLKKKLMQAVHGITVVEV